MVQLVSVIADCKKKLLNDDDLIVETKSIYTTSSDDILVEFSSILLHHICDDPKRVDSLARDEFFLKSTFAKFKSHDADILLHSIQLLNVLMKNSMLIESVLVHNDFPFKNLQIELQNEITEIQVAALESLLMITNFRENPFWEMLSSERLIEVIFAICLVRLHNVLPVLLLTNFYFFAAR